MPKKSFNFNGDDTVNTVEKYNEYVNISMVAAIQPVVFDRTEGALVFDENGRDILKCWVRQTTNFFRPTTTILRSG